VSTSVVESGDIGISFIFLGRAHLHLSAQAQTDRLEFDRQMIDGDVFSFHFFGRDFLPPIPVPALAIAFPF
jgi:5'-3' exonuclease